MARAPVVILQVALQGGNEPGGLGPELCEITSDGA